MIFLQMPDGEIFEVRKSLEAPELGLLFMPVYEHYYTNYIGWGIHNFNEYRNILRFEPYYKNRKGLCVTIPTYKQESHGI